MIRIYVANRTERRTYEHESGQLELGRGPRRTLPRRMIQDPQVSNDQLLVEELPKNRLRIENLSRRVSVTLANGVVIGPGAAHEAELPLRCTAGETLIEFDSVEDPGSASNFALRTVAPPVQASTSSTRFTLAGREEAGPSTEELARWFETIVAVQRAAAASPEFYAETARAVVEQIGLDHGLVLLREGDEWKPAAQHSADGVASGAFSRSILQRVCEERLTFYQGVPSGAQTASLEGIAAVVAAPVFAKAGERIVGVVYGSRSLRAGRPAAAIQPLEAQLVQVLAAAVGAGLARMTSETEAARRLVRFEQFVSAELARELDRDPDLLEGRDREVTVLFGDLRGFSRIAERLDPRETCHLLSDLMEQFTARIHENGGAVVDYVGDGILAMWNAPVAQPTHAVMACRAALAMLAELPKVNDRWKDRLGTPLEIGVGVNTGTALVGNTGSRSKLKYGPHGHTVNVASRVEGATKQLGVPILITGETRARLAGAFATRRLCRTRLVGIAGAVDLFELTAADADPSWKSRRDTYEAGLAQYEAGRWAEACHTLNGLLMGPDGRYDLPSLGMLSRAIECLKNPPHRFDPVVELSTK